MVKKESMYSMLSTSFKLLSGPLAIILITTKLSPIEQGVYYMFLSLSAIQWVFELGITTCMVQYISTSENDKEKRRYINFLSLFISISSMFLFVFLYYFSFYVFSDINVDLWFEPWLLYVSFICLNLFYNILIVIEEGFGNIEYVYKTKMLSAIAYSTTLIASLFLDFYLFSLFLAQLSMFIVVYYRERHLNKWVFCKEIFSSYTELRETFWEVIPFQYKLSVIWIAGYLYWNSFQFLFFKYVSPELAGYFGATNGVFGAFSMIAISLVSTQRARWGKINEVAGYSHTYNLFKKESGKGLCLYVLLSLLFILFFFYIPLPFLKERLLPWTMLVLLCLFRFCILFQEFILIYLRTFKDEPLYKTTLVNYMLLPVVILVGISVNNVNLIFINSLIFQILFSIFYFRNMKLYLDRKNNFD